MFHLLYYHCEWLVCLYMPQSYQHFITTTFVICFNDTEFRLRRIWVRPLSLLDLCTRLWSQLFRHIIQRFFLKEAIHIWELSSFCILSDVVDHERSGCSEIIRRHTICRHPKLHSVLSALMRLSPVWILVFCGDDRHLFFVADFLFIA